MCYNTYTADDICCVFRVILNFITQVTTYLYIVICRHQQQYNVQWEEVTENNHHHVHITRLLF